MTPPPYCENLPNFSPPHFISCFAGQPKFLANQIFDFVKIKDFRFTRTESGLKVYFKVDLRYGVKHSSIISHKCK